MDEKKISNAEVREILEKQLQLLSERSHQIANNTERGKELPLLTEAMIKLAVILEPEIQSEESSEALVSYLENRRILDKLEENWERQRKERQ